MIRRGMAKWVGIVFATLPLVASLWVSPAAALVLPGALQIDASLAAKGSPLAGHGHEFVAAGQASGVDPAFLVAIAGAETGFGNLIYHRGADYCEFNAWNWFYGPTRAASDFSSWEDGLQHVARGLAGPRYYGSGRFAVCDIAPIYCPDGTRSWIVNVTTFMSELGGNPADTRLAAASTTSPASAWGEPSASDPPPDLSVSGPKLPTLTVAATSATRSRLPLLEMVGPVLAPGIVARGKCVEITFTVKNTGLQAGRWERLETVLRRPDGKTLQCGPSSELTLVPGQQTTFTVSQTVDVGGAWVGAVFVSNAGAWYLLGVNPAFAVMVRGEVAAEAASLSPGPRQRRISRWVLLEERGGTRLRRAP